MASGVLAKQMLAYIPFPPPFLVTALHRGEPPVLGRDRSAGSSGWRGMVVAFACVTGSLSHRRPYPGHSPSSDLYEPSTFPPRSPRLIHAVLIRGRNRFGAIIAPGAMPTYGPAVLSAEGTQPPTVLVPASRSYRLLMHVSTMTLSHAALPRGSLLATAFLVTATSTEGRANGLGNLGTPVRSFDNGGRRGDEGLLSNLLPLPVGYRERQLSRRLDYWSYRTVSLGFLFSTPGIPPGAVWANEARGYHRNRDPKETRASITRLAFAIHPHTRITRGWQGKESAVVAPPGFPITRIRYLGVNPSGRGSHSHGWLV
uniref:Cytochrome c heme attachment protein n=1 Tax=Selaginella tamariscina TaxID=137178 RepID=A0A482CKY1_9TRAC|nr:cytochrome c heme attachment protein [Selaginella tamariscina]QBL76438.1 cytochrome c heme attachment protein [Selaginella tamariscina]